MNILTEVCLSHNELFSPPSPEATYAPALMREVERGARAHAPTCQPYISCQRAVSTGAQACTHTHAEVVTLSLTHCNLMTLVANELLWCLPDTHGGCRMGATAACF